MRGYFIRQMVPDTKGGCDSGCPYKKFKNCAIRAAKARYRLSIRRLKIGRVLEEFEVGRRCGASYG
jgi:hypothetical protein